MKCWSYLLVLIMLVTLCACGGGVAPAASSQSDPDTRPSSQSDTSSSSSQIDEPISSQSASADSVSSVPDPGSVSDPPPASASDPVSSQPAAASSTAPAVSPYSSIPQYTNDPNDPKYVDPRYRETYAVAHPDLAAFEGALKDMGISFTVSSGSAYSAESLGAKSIRIYRIGGGRFRIYEFDMNSDAYAAAKEGEVSYDVDGRRQGFVISFTRKTLSDINEKTGQPKSSTVITLDEEGIASSKDIIEAFVNNIG